MTTTICVPDLSARPYSLQTEHHIASTVGCRIISCVNEQFDNWLRLSDIAIMNADWIRN